MKILYDKEMDVLHIVLKNDVGMLTTEAHGDVSISLDDDQEVSCIEVARASARVDLSEYVVKLNAKVTERFQ